MKKLNDAEAKFFETQGEEVHESLQKEPAETAAAAEAAPAAPEAAPTTKDEPKAEPKPESRQVPLEALQAERQKRQQVEAEFTQLRQALEAAARQQQTPEPSFDEDPIAALAYQNRQLSEQVQQFQQWQQQQELQRQQQSAYQGFTQHVIAAEQQFAAEHPDYNEASQFAIQMYDKMLAVSIPDAAQRRAQLQTIAAAELARVVQSGGNPAEFIYNFARQMGYAQEQPQAAAAPPAPEPETVRKIRKGLQQQANLSGGGATPATEYTPEMLASLSTKNPKAFNAAWAKAFAR